MRGPTAPVLNSCGNRPDFQPLVINEGDLAFFQRVAQHIAKSRFLDVEVAMRAPIETGAE